MLLSIDHNPGLFFTSQIVCSTLLWALLQSSPMAEYAGEIDIIQIAKIDNSFQVFMTYPSIDL